MIRFPARSTSIALLALAFAGCRSGGVGSVSGSLVELYDAASPTGAIEIEADRNGRLRELEAETPIESLPAAVRAAALERARGGVIVGAERELASYGWGWEVKVWHDGRHMELVYDEDGDLLESEIALHGFEWPPYVLIAAESSLPGGFVKSVEIVQRRNAPAAHHVKKEIGGASYKLVVESDGRVSRRVREQRAEIEIPLRE